MSEVGVTIKKEDKGSYKAKLTTIRIVRAIICIFFCILSIFPFYTVLVNASLPSAEIQKGVHFVFGDYFSKNWAKMMAETSKKLTIWQALKNSALITIPATILAVYVSTLTAYGIHVYEFKLKRFTWAFVLAIMMIPTQVSMIGFLRMITMVGLDNNYLSLIIPAAVAPSTIFFMRQYMRTGLPLEIIEAARIDGSGELKTFNYITMPLMKPAVATQAIFAFIATWNNLYNPQMVLTSTEKGTLPMFVQGLKSDGFKADYGAIYVGIAASILPILIVYAILSKYIIAGVALGGVKE